jgi:hypothetical protein
MSLQCLDSTLGCLDTRAQSPAMDPDHGDEDAPPGPLPDPQLDQQVASLRAIDGARGQRCTARPPVADGAEGMCIIPGVGLELCSSRSSNSQCIFYTHQNTSTTGITILLLPEPVVIRSCTVASQCPTTSQPTPEELRRQLPAPRAAHCVPCVQRHVLCVALHIHRTVLGAVMLGWCCYTVVAGRLNATVWSPATAVQHR